MPRTVYVTQGEFADRYMRMEDADAATAIADGWARENETPPEPDPENPNPIQDPNAEPPESLVRVRRTRPIPPRLNTTRSTRSRKQRRPRLRRNPPVSVLDGRIGMPMIWIYRGQHWPVHERLQNVSVEDAKQAEAEGWGHRVAGLDGRDCKQFDELPHAASDAYYTRMTRARTAARGKPPPEEAGPPSAPTGGEYGNREMTSVKPPNKGGCPRKDERPWLQS